MNSTRGRGGRGGFRGRGRGRGGRWNKHGSGRKPGPNPKPGPTDNPQIPNFATYKDVIRELHDKLRPTIKNVDEKIYDHIETYYKLVDFISNNTNNDKTMDAFFNLCKLFTLPDLKTCKDANKQSTIYAIFFDGSKFKLSTVIHKIVLNTLQKKSGTIFTDSNLDIMFDFFKVLIDVSSPNFDILKPDFILLESVSSYAPKIKIYIDQINQHFTIKEQNELNSFESAISPTIEDLTKDKKGKIDNNISRIWGSFNEYKRAMIDLTKENFYTPFRKSLDELKKGELDYRDLFLYEDVCIPFISNIEHYKIFKECNFFLSFKIRMPPNFNRRFDEIDWIHTERLGNRSLLILSTSPDLLKVDAVCRSCAAARSLDEEQSRATINFLRNGFVPVVLISGQIKENVKYYMFEPTACWPAVQPILQRLLKMDEHIFPHDLTNKIIKLDFTNNDYPEDKKINTDVLLLDRPPRTMRKQYEKMASETWDFDLYSNEQMSSLLRVDHEQYRALRYALTHNLTLVNGAPGTGKTHYAREYLRVMNELSHPKPIVVVTFTNHALDSILEGVLQFIKPQHLIRWGGPMRSKNPKLIDRKWKNCYLSRDIRDEKNEIVTKKQSLKNMYNIRQMTAQYINAISKDPTDVNNYKQILYVLNFFFKARERMAAYYPIDLTREEINEYNMYLNNRDNRIRHVPLPNIDDAINCWLNGEKYVNERNAKIRETLNFNRGIIFGEVYQNPYLNLKSDEDDNVDFNEEEEEEEEENEEENENNEISSSKPSKLQKIKEYEKSDDDSEEKDKDYDNKEEEDKDYDNNEEEKDTDYDDNEEEDNDYDDNKDDYLKSIKSQKDKNSDKDEDYNVFDFDENDKKQTKSNKANNTSHSISDDEDDDDFDFGQNDKKQKKSSKKHSKHHSTSDDDDDDFEDNNKKQKKSNKKHSKHHSTSDDDDDFDFEDNNKKQKKSNKKHNKHHSISDDDDDFDFEDNNDKKQKKSNKKHRKHHSTSDDEDDFDNNDKKQKKPSKKHRKHHSTSDDDDDFDFDNNNKKQKKSNKKHRKHHSTSDDDNDNDSGQNDKKQKKTNKKRHNHHSEYDFEEEESKKEEEEQKEDKIYNDEDVVEMARVSFDGTIIEENLPKKYVQEVLEQNFSTLFTNPTDNKKTPSELMINYLKIISDPLTRMIDQYEKELEKYEIDFNDRETISAGRYLQKMKIIGMTSTVASVRKEALEIAGCEILIVEEAGELTESMLSCILPSTLKRMILIGDYQQLRPKVEHEMTGQPCNYDISLFEKLVVNAKAQNASCLFTLSVQRRMHPQISELIRKVFYSSGNEQINDADSTNSLGIPYGIPHRVRFFMHNYEENKVKSRSHANIQEAKFCASLVPFFICRGYKPEDITIISLYKGQMFQIQREIESLFEKYQNNKGDSKLFKPFGNIRSARQIKIVVLDNFQGEENKVIIVSLTRSDKPGFVKNRNRALVTLSRAREMLVVLGNERVFGMNCKNNDQWKTISTVASELSRFSMSKPNEEGIAVNKCEIHQPHSDDIPSFLETPQQIYDYRFSFCKEKCNFQLPCTHLCQLTCHCHSYPPGPNEHDNYYCPFQCLKRCENGHQCKGTCGKCTHNGYCPHCHEIIHHTFPCGHEDDIECYIVTSGKAVCNALCGKIIERCGHPCVLKCGHKGNCNCKVRLQKECENCRKTFYYFCGDENPKCTKHCNFILPCGHRCSSKCSECIERGHHDLNCNHQCEFIFPCGHRCQCKCYQKFPEHQHFICQQEVQLNHNFCGNHNKSTMQECSSPISCEEPCQHSCYICHKSCNKSCSDLCIERCNCQCKLQCSTCGKRCRALTGEKCAIFCQHCMNVKEPPAKAGLIYVFHGNHFLPLNEAKEKIMEQYNSIVNGEGDLPVPISRLKCPIDGCNCKDPCILGSWLFDKYNKGIENVLAKIRMKSEQYIELNKYSSNESQFDKIHWYICENCGELFFIKFDNPDNLTVKCPNCQMQKGEMFE